MIKGTEQRLGLPATVTVLDGGAVRIVTKGGAEPPGFGVDGNMMGMMGDITTVEATAVVSSSSRSIAVVPDSPLKIPGLTADNGAAPGKGAVGAGKARPPRPARSSATSTWQPPRWSSRPSTRAASTWAILDGEATPTGGLGAG